MGEVRNSEMLFLYEAKLCNPNGDPDDENRPRMDPRTRRNLVSDVRLKRYFRDYVINRFGEDYIWVTRLGGESVRAHERLAELLKKEGYEVQEDNLRQWVKKNRDKVVRALKRNLIDFRLFGATVPVGKGEETRGESMSFTGPVQFSWGFSLHPVELVDSATITSTFAGREEKPGYGTMGKDWRLYYSLIAFYGVVSGRRAKETGMREEDVKILDDFLWRALLQEATTRSKIGQRPLLYMRVEYKDAETLLGDLRRFLKVDYSERAPIRELSDVKIDFSGLVDALKGMKEKKRIEKIYVRCSQDLDIREVLRSEFPDLLVEVEELPEKDFPGLLLAEEGQAEGHGGGSSSSE